MEISGQPWDVNRYRSEFESEEHWQLRKRFMLTHMNKFPEDKLVCLTQVFFNVEFLGCRYPEETMKMIAELSIGVADDHREKQKGKLKRTFVAASDAAGARIKGYDTPTPKEPASKLARLGEDTDVSDSKESEGFCQAHMRFAKPPMKLLPPSGGFPGLILFEIRNNLGELISCPINILNMSVAKNVIWRNIEFSVLGSKCEVKINDKLLASAKGGTAKEAKLNAATKGLEILRRNCYTIQMKQAFYSSDPSITKDVKVGESDDNRLSADNIGSKMMQKMGWAGSGLGKSQQGIQEPIQAASQIFKRQGFGHEDPKEMEKKFSKLFQDYIESDSDNDLVFSPEFSSAERKILHRNHSSVEGDCDSDDLFGSEAERHLDADDDNDLEEIEEPSVIDLCCVCSKLKAVTGEETDDDIYSTMWLTLSEEPGELSDSDDAKDYVTECMGETSGTKNSSADKIKKVGENKCTTVKPAKFIVCRYKFPDGSSMRVPKRFIITNKVLFQYTFPDGDQACSNVTVNVSQDDLNTIPFLKESLMRFNHRRKFPKNILNVGVANPNILDLTGSDNGAESVPNIDTLKINTSNTISNKLNAESVHYKLPNGTIISIPKQYIMDHAYLWYYTFPGGGKSVSQSTIHVSREDLQFVPGLRECITNFIIKRKLNPLNIGNCNSLTKEKPSSSQISNTKAQISTSNANVQSMEPNKEIVIQQTPPIDSGDKQISDVPILDRIKIFLPDGSYKRITVSCVMADEALRKFAKCKKSTMNYIHYASVQDLKENASLRDLFSDFLFPCKPFQKEGEIMTVVSEDVKMIMNKSLENMDNECSNKAEMERMEVCIPETDTYHRFGSEINIAEINTQHQKENNDKMSLVTIEMESPHTDNGKKQTSSKDLNDQSVKSNKSVLYESGPSQSLFDKKSPEESKDTKVDTIKVFCPDGSYKRITIDQVLADEGLKKFTKYSTQNPVTSKYFATVQDIKANSALQGLFSDFLSGNKTSQLKVDQQEFKEGWRYDDKATSIGKMTTSTNLHENIENQGFGPKSNIEMKLSPKVTSTDDVHSEEESCNSETDSNDQNTTAADDNQTNSTKTGKTGLRRGRNRKAKLRLTLPDNSKCRVGVNELLQIPTLAVYVTNPEKRCISFDDMQNSKELIEILFQVLAKNRLLDLIIFNLEISESHSHHTDIASESVSEVNEAAPATQSTNPNVLSICLSSDFQPDNSPEENSPNTKYTDNHTYSFKKLSVRHENIAKDYEVSENISETNIHDIKENTIATNESVCNTSNMVDNNSKPFKFGRNARMNFNLPDGARIRIPLKHVMEYPSLKESLIRFKPEDRIKARKFISLYDMKYNLEIRCMLFNALTPHSFYLIINRKKSATVSNTITSDQFSDDKIQNKPKAETLPIAVPSQFSATENMRMRWEKFYATLQAQQNIHNKANVKTEANNKPNKISDDKTTESYTTTQNQSVDILVKKDLGEDKCKSDNEHFRQLPLGSGCLPPFLKERDLPSFKSLTMSTSQTAFSHCNKSEPSPTLGPYKHIQEHINSLSVDPLHSIQSTIVQDPIHRHFSSYAFKKPRL